SVFITHLIALLILYFFYRKCIKKLKNTYFTGIYFFLSTIVYYIILLIPVHIIQKILFETNTEQNILLYYKNLLSEIKLETISTSIIVSIYSIQIRLQQILKKHKQNLELTVQDRTEKLKTSNEELETSNEEFETSNEEISTTNEELYFKSEIINKQNAELKATLLNLKETQAKLIQAEKMSSLGILTSGVAHEINNPLNYIAGSYMGLKDYFDENKIYDKDIRFFLESLNTGFTKVADIVKSLTQFSSSNKDLDKKYNIHSIIDNCLLMLNNQIKNKIKIEKNYTKQKIIIKGNIGKLHQVFVNIFLNSVHAISEKGTISIKTLSENNSIKIIITDTGYGIAEDTIDKIFDPFFTTKDPDKGVGLGLSVTRNIINNHNGKIKYISEINKGTTVTIWFPIDQ
ncbi:MAG: ATP-binding protein, partial [Bacteroidota bacterium]|nr:ATP-binding protein [Bacteroidota bacterium]